MVPSYFKLPSAMCPVAMSLAALSLVLGHVALFGILYTTPTKGTAAHLYQLLFMAGQVPVIGYFLVPERLPYSGNAPVLGGGRAGRRRGDGLRCALLAWESQ